MSTYTRIMTGVRNTRKPVSNTFVVTIVVAALTASVIVGDTYFLRGLLSPLGVVSCVAIAAGLAARRDMAVTPWGLLTAALVAQGIANAVDGGLSVVLSVLEYGLLAGACVVGSTQLKVELTSSRKAARPPRARWGAVLVATGFFASVTVYQALSWSAVPQISVPRASSDAGQWAPARFGPPTRVGRVEDPNITESSGLVASRVNPGVLWTHNDSGDRALYCLRSNGRSCGTVHIAGVEQRDWEGIAAGPGDAGTSDALYVGDIGDNRTTRDSIVVYVLPEPKMSASVSSSSVVSAEAIRLRYPDRPHDAEALTVHPVSGDIYVITKDHPAQIFKASAPLDHERVSRLSLVGTLSISDNLSDVTGADVSADGTRVAISTYGAGFELEVSSTAVRTFDEIWKAKLARFRLGSRAQGEAIAYDLSGDAIHATTEGLHSPVWRVRARP